MAKRTKLAWARELLEDCEAAIAGQKKLIEHDGGLTAHRLSLKALQREKVKLQEEIAALEGEGA